METSPIYITKLIVCTFNIKVTPRDLKESGTLFFVPILRVFKEEKLFISVSMAIM